MALQPLRNRDVIIVQNRDELSARLFESPIPCSTWPFRDREPQQSEPGIGRHHRFHGLWRLATVIHNDHFEIDPRLLLEGLERPPEQSRTVPGRHNDTHGWQATHKATKLEVPPGFSRGLPRPSSRPPSTVPPSGTVHCFPPPQLPNHPRRSLVDTADCPHILQLSPRTCVAATAPASTGATNHMHPPPPLQRQHRINRPMMAPLPALMLFPHRLHHRPSQ
ncbi:MAG: hypothetical protein KatS3mg005_1265 [Bryobacteraceae bacterium]|nr:MAG: hypothetical protein KatS3mg005_1265 [Bryobacteraceae bacterium]